MQSQDAITVTAWDEVVSSTIKQGTALTFAIPDHLPYRQIYFYLEARLADPLNDFFLTGAISLTHYSSLKAEIPASIGSNLTSTMVKKSILSLFTHQIVNRGTDGVAITGNAIRSGARVLLADGFSASVYNLVELAPLALLARANRLSYFISDWSRTGGNNVTGYRAFACVLSSSHSFT